MNRQQILHDLIEKADTILIPNYDKKQQAKALIRHAIEFLLQDGNDIDAIEKPILGRSDSFVKLWDEVVKEKTADRKSRAEHAENSARGRRDEKDVQTSEPVSYARFTGNTFEILKKVALVDAYKPESDSAEDYNLLEASRAGELRHLHNELLQAILTSNELHIDK